MKRRKLIVLAAFVGTLLAVWLLFNRYGSFETLVHHEMHVRDYLAEHRLKGMLLGFVAYILLSLIPGTGGKSMVFGWLYGFWPAVLIADVSLSLAACITFLFSRYMLREGLQSKFSVAMARLDRAVQKEGAWYVFAMRMMYSPYTLTNYAMGATCVRLRSFLLATIVGLLPGTMIFVFVGTRIPRLEDAVRGGAAVILTPEILSALVVMAVFPPLARWAIRRYWRGTVVEQLPGTSTATAPLRNDDAPAEPSA